ncbi:ATP-binding cassette domain-containing protein [Fundicoccus culcitae]|uniref:ATP-binding cassette domain-containing protein n=1 Tax=Fundicoccus culcitae TaxID=2969821 RepID=A0ABY5P451_9LACT|nr:ATP-binding cassette domain-containing protein [Fundicoccus culcitae]UUX33518.1 ATP-binding cassette domain-containing protein [Fundicoccus culcitae]
MTENILELTNVSKYFELKEGFFNRKTQTVKAVENVSFVIPKRQTFAVVGESGSGKSTLANLIMKFTDVTQGDIRFKGESILTLTDNQLNTYRQQVQMVFQDPSSSLNPSKTLRQIIEEPMIIHKVGDAVSRKKRVEELLEVIRLPKSFIDRYPHTLSGGQKQRVGIARAIALDCDLLILDEPTSALDVSVQATIIQLLEEIQAEFGMTYFFITHDLALVKNFCDEAIVMKSGEIIERGPVKAIFNHPQEDYTKKLIKAIPVISKEEEDFLASIGV